MAEPTRAATLPIGSVVVVGDTICQKRYDRIDGEHWTAAMLWSGQPVHDREMDRMMATQGAQVLRVGSDPRPTLAPDARERLARHLFLDVATTPARRAAVYEQWPGLSEADRQPYYRRADEILTVIAGKDSSR